MSAAALAKLFATSRKLEPLGDCCTRPASPRSCTRPLPSPASSGSASDGEPGRGSADGLPAMSAADTDRTAAAAEASGDGVTLQAPPVASAAGPSFSLVDVPALLARIGKPPEGKAGRGRGKAAPGRDKRDDALYLALEPVAAAQEEAAAAAQRSWSGAAQRLKKEEEGGADSGAVVQLGSAREVDTFERRMVAWLEGARDRAEAMDSEAAGESASADGAGVGAKIAEAAATRISGCGGDASRESELDAAL